MQVKVLDKDGGSKTGDVTVTLKNVAPTISSVTADPSQLTSTGGNSVITVVASDPAGASDPLQYSFDCDGNNSFEVVPQAGNATTCTFAGGDPPVRKVNVKVDDGDGGVITGDTLVIVGAAVDLAILPKISNLDIGSTGDLKLHVTADTPVDKLHAVIKFGWRIQITASNIVTVSAASNKLPNVTVTVTPSGAGGTGDGTIILTATADSAVTGDFDLVTVTFNTVSIGPADVKFVEGTAATSDAASVLRSAFPAEVKVQGDVGVQLKVNLQAPAPNNNERFLVALYKKGVFGPATADMPWLIFGATPVYTADLLVTADSGSGGKGFTVLLTGDDVVRTGIYDVTIVTVRGSGGLKDTLANLRDNLNIDRPPDDLEMPLITDMKTLLEGNAVNDTRPNVELSTIVNALDASLLAAVIKAGSYDVRVDFTRDGGTVDDADFNLLQSNYLKFSPVILAPE